MEDHHHPISLPPDYQENALFLLVQSPRVLYAYWELSPGLKGAINNEKKKVHIRLNVEGRGPYLTCEIDLSTRSHYFSDVEPGLMYNCEIGIFHAENGFFPLLRSNSINAPQDRPPDRRITEEDQASNSFSVTNASSWLLYDKK